MPFSPGDHVHVAALGKGIVREVRNADRYVVELKGRSIVVEARQLTTIDPAKPGGNRGARPAATSNAASPLERLHAPSTLDLHGLTVMEAVAALDAFINDAILAGRQAVQVIHGRGGGRVKAAVHARLRELPVRHFRLDPSNPGVTIAEL
jgi:DNA mismatch repair protein MutS2